MSKYAQKFIWGILWDAMDFFEFFAKFWEKEK
jgi:hypothetical protein